MAKLIKNLNITLNIIEINVPESRDNSYLEDYKIPLSFSINYYFLINLSEAPATRLL